MDMKKKVAVIGSGFSALSASCYLAKQGFEVSIFEKNDTVGELINQRGSRLNRCIGISIYGREDWASMYLYKVGLEMPII